ncbi:MAG: cytochrome d ubiquinol oxidase subunit II [Acidobacteriota bacterium]|jgi:cytochrome bd ubiquinol oxidase subunit II
MTLNVIWFILIGVLITGYAILDGFDLGVGVLHPLAKGDQERRTFLNAIGPVWDGNEVWLLTGGGALFAAFPPVYATVFSGFYLAMMLVLLGLILRAVSLEFRSKVQSAAWRRTWDTTFFVGSFLPAVLFGVATGNLMRGIPIDHSGAFTGGFLGLLNPYSVVMGLLSLTLFTMQGAAFLSIRTEGDLQNRARKWLLSAWAVFLVLYVAEAFWSLHEAPYLFARYGRSAAAWIAPVILWAAIIAVPIAALRKRFGWTFLATSACILGLNAVLAVGAFPYLAPSSTDLNYSLTAFNSSSSPLTLEVMFILALIGMPLVLAYTAYIYWVFRGKVKVEPEGY